MEIILVQKLAFIFGACLFHYNEGDKISWVAEKLISKEVDFFWNQVIEQWLRDGFNSEAEVSMNLRTLDATLAPALLN